MALSKILQAAGKEAAKAAVKAATKSLTGKARLGATAVKRAAK
jgi:hypothetical protein